MPSPPQPARRRLGLLLTLLLAAASAAAGPLLLQVGPLRIDALDLDLRRQVEALYGAAPGQAAVAVTLVNEALEEAVARRLGVAPTAAEVAALARHADETSRNPELLARIKALFGPDEGAYRRLYLRPKVTAEKLRAFHSRTRSIHAAQTAKIETAQRLAGERMGFAEIAARLGLDHRHPTPPSATPELPEAMRQFGFSAADLPPDPLQALLEPLEPGALYPQIVETDQAFQLVRRLERGEKGIRYESLAIAKRPYGEWFQEQAAGIPIRVAPPELRDAIVTEYPQVWWIRRLDE